MKVKSCAKFDLYVRTGYGNGFPLSKVPDNTLLFETSQRFSCPKWTFFREIFKLLQQKFLLESCKFHHCSWRLETNNTLTPVTLEYARRFNWNWSTMHPLFTQGGDFATEVRIVTCLSAYWLYWLSLLCPVPCCMRYLFYFRDRLKPRCSAVPVSVCWMPSPWNTVRHKRFHTVRNCRLTRVSARVRVRVPEPRTNGIASHGMSISQRSFSYRQPVQSRFLSQRSSSIIGHRELRTVQTHHLTGSTGYILSLQLSERDKPTATKKSFEGGKKGRGEIDWWQMGIAVCNYVIT